MNKFSIAALTTCLFVSSALFAAAPAIVDQATADLQKFSGMTGKLEVLEDGKSNDLLGSFPCSIEMDKWFPENGEYAVYSISLLKSSAYKFVLYSSVNMNFGKGAAGRSSNYDVITYQNKFDRSSAGDLGTMYCGSYGHMSVTASKAVNLMQISSSQVQIRINYSCPIYSPDKLAGKHVLQWTCQF